MNNALRNLTALFTLTCMSTLVTPTATAQGRPNIIVLMADDLGYNDVGCYGCKDIRTPNIDKLAADGVRFASAYVTGNMCGPSRAGFLTGRQQSSFGYYRNVNNPYDPAQGLPKIPTIASLLQKQGYVTGGVGKWHMGTADHQHPNAMGFDDWFGFLGGGLMYYPLDHPSYAGRFAPLQRPLHHKYVQHTMPVIHNKKVVQWEQYLTRELTDAGVAFIERNQKNEEPFFLFMSYNAPHLDLEAPKETIAKYPNDKMTVVPGVKPSARSVYAAMVDEMDQGIGKLLDKLDALDLADKTVVWFLSDHGGMKRTSDNRPLRGHKGSRYEGGLRVPMIVKWPGKTRANKVLEAPVTSLDIGATSLAMAGADPVESGLHGKDIRNYIGSQSQDAPHQVLFWHTGGYKSPSGAMRDGDYKLLYSRSGTELYNLKNDLSETTNLAADEPERLKTMVARWKSWTSETARPELWTRRGKLLQYADYEWLKGSPHCKKTQIEGSSETGELNCFGFSAKDSSGLQKWLRFDSQRSYILSAHRGGTQSGFPENCIATFEHSLAHGSTMLEVDPRLTKDGVIVLHHDKTLDRTTSGSGLLSDRTLAELQQLTLTDSNGEATPHKMPTLQQAIDWARNKTILVVDQKDVPLDQRIAAISDNNAEGFVMLIVGNLKQAQQVHASNPKIAMEVMVPDLKRVKAIDESKLPWRNLIAFIGHQPPYDPSLIEAIHDRGAMCMAGTSRNLDLKLIKAATSDPAKSAPAQPPKSLAERYRNLLDLGIDIIETDLPIQVHDVLRPN